LIFDGGALDVIEQDHSSLFATIKCGKGREITWLVMLIRYGPKSTSAELELSKNLQARQESFRETMSEESVCAIPKRHSSL
jgi:hypothetical protein